MDQAFSLLFELADRISYRMVRYFRE